MGLQTTRCFLNRILSSQGSWNGPRAMDPETAALQQQHTARNAAQTIQIWGRLKTLRKKMSGGQTQRLPPAFLPVPPNKLFINIPKHTNQWRIHGDSLNTKILSIMASRTSLTPSSSSTPCPGWIAFLQLLLYLQQRSPYWTPSSPIPSMSADHL